MKPKDSADDLIDLGRKIRDARKRKHITLEDLASGSGVSKSVLSQVERGVTNPTLSTLWNIARALSLDPLELFGGSPKAKVKEATGSSVIAEVDDPVIDNGAKNYKLIILNRPELAGECELYRLLLGRGGILKSNPHEAGAIEQLTVLEGEVEIICGNDTHRVGVGRTARYPGDLPHEIRTVDKQGADVLLFVTFA